jgi:fibronectin type 3 domain-containing protein
VSYGQSYFYRVTANDDAGNESTATDEASASPIDATPPAAPSGLAVTDETTNLVVLGWTANGEGDLTGYNVYASATAFSAKGSANRVNSALLTETSFEHSGLTNGETLHYRITAVDGAGNESALSAEVTGTPVDETAPAAPENFVVSNESDEEVTLTWNVGSETDLGGYNLYRAPNSFTDLSSAQRLNTDLITRDGYIDDGLSNGETYYYRLTAVDQAGNESEASAEVVAEPRDNVAPDAPTALTVEAGDNSGLLEWTAANASDVDGYYVYRSTSSFNDPMLATRVNAEVIGSTAYQLTGLTNGQPYALRVTAVDGSGNESDLSQEITFTPEDTTPPVQIAEDDIEIIPGENEIRIQFPDGSTMPIAGGGDVADYDVYYGSEPFSDTTAVDLLPGAFGPGEEATIGNLDIGETVYIRIVATDDDGLRSPASDEQVPATKDLTPPSAPTSLVADVNETSVDLSWDANGEGDLAGYHVYRATSSFSDSTRAARINEGLVGSPSLTDAEVQNGQRYFYRIVAVDTTGNQSDLSAEVDGRPIDEVAPDALGAPTLVAGSRTVDVSFAASAAADVVGYNVYRALSAFSVKGDAVKINDGLLTQREIRDGDLINGKKYFYRVTAVDDVGNESDLGAIASTIPVDDLPPGLPKGFTANASDGIVSLSWTAGSEADLDGYKVYRATVTTPPGVNPDDVIGGGAKAAKGISGVDIGEETLVNSEPAKNSVEDDGVENNVAYRYRIAAVDTVGNESERGLPIIAQPVNDVFFAAPTASGEGDGGTWNDAAPLKEAIAAADEGDAIWLVGGTYTIGVQPGAASGASSTKAGGEVNPSVESVFTLPAGAKLYGGFSGKEGSLSERDPKENRVIITADVDGNDQRASGGITEIATQQEGSNAAHVITVQPGDPSARTIIDGVTLTAGQATGDGRNSRGGAIYCDATGSADFACNIEVVDVTIAGNKAQEGGAIFVGGAQSTLDLVNVRINGNRASAQGGAIALAGARGRFANVVLNGNEAGQDGGAIYFRALDGQQDGPLPALYNATVAGNVAGSRGAALFAQGGSGDGLVTNSILHENSAPQGSVVLAGGAKVTIDHSLVPSALQDAAAEQKTLSMANSVRTVNARFVDDSGFDGLYGTLDDDFRLKPESEAIGAGSNEAVVNDWIDLDADGNTSEPLPLDVYGAERLSAFGSDEPMVDLGAIEQDEEIIPVSVDGFAGESDGRIPTLTWSTTQEINNAAFELQRESTGGGFETIATLDGSGTTQERVDYSYTDKEVPYEKKETRYRLRQVDEDGTTRLMSEIGVGIETPETLELFGNYPNPFQQATVIRYRLHRRTHVTLSIYNEIGQRVAQLVDERQRPGRNEIRFNGASMPSGLYFLRLEAGGERITRRMVLVR